VEAFGFGRGCVGRRVHGVPVQGFQNLAAHILPAHWGIWAVRHEAWHIQVMTTSVA